ncbi:hypothetical protein Sru01_64810 [Sphaerisporangium rufum]|uniref:Uncharacterized protein n=1 Tax=Sphaerisporangium rufum TaxID=1381558 RepID=A0A919R8R6_9ACTN|nr:hypothetical protein [Sphaerisporangium rufum]GII81499.1 hypothetical protein Sru01_64810 [Sphaerisporangium rufum]
MRLAAALALLLCLGVLTGCGTSRSPGAARSAPPAPEVTVDEITRFARLDMPPHPSDVQTGGESGIDRLVLLRFSAPATEVRDFLTGSGFPAPKKGAQGVQSDLGTRLGWGLDELSGTEGASDDTGDLVRQVTIDRSTPDRPTVYVAAFTV